MTTSVYEFDSALALGATGRLREFNQAGVILAADVHVASRLTATIPNLILGMLTMFFSSLCLFIFCVKTVLHRYILALKAYEASLGKTALGVAYEPFVHRSQKLIVIFPIMLLLQGIICALGQDYHVLKAPIIRIAGRIMQGGGI